MIFDQEELDRIKYVPAKMQRVVLDMLANNESDLTLEDPTNPFTMLLEANVMMTHNAISETTSHFRKLFPSLAASREDLYHHISTIEEENIFSTAADVDITFYINVLDILDKGIDVSDVDNSIIKKIVTLPKFTEVNVGDTPLTLLNDIEITLQIDPDNNTKQVFVEQKTNIVETSDNALGNLYSSISVDADNVEWVVFTTNLKQIKRTSTEFSLTKDISFSQNIPYTDNYSYSEVFVKSGDDWEKIETTHSEIIYDRTKPTIRITVDEETIRYTIPDFYMLDNSISNIIRIDTYTTKGKILLPLTKFNVGDFTIQLPKYFYSESSAVMSKIDKLANSNNVLDGGVTSYKLRELRNKIIYNTTGTLDLPITEKQLNELAKTKGFTLYKAIDTVTDRIFIASKNINDVYNTNRLPSNIDLFNNTLVFLPGEIESKHVYVEDDGILIKSNTLFKSVNGITKVVNDTEEDALLSSTSQTREELMQTNEYYFTPFYYILDTSDDVLNSRIYNLDTPELSNMEIINKNIFVEHNVNISRYVMTKTDTGYRFILSLYGNEAFNSLDKNQVFIQMALKINNAGNQMFFTSTYDSDIDKYVIDIKTNFMVDIEDRLTILNGYSSNFVNKLMLENEAEFIVYVNTNSIPADAKYVPTSEILNRTATMTALCKEKALVIFGNNLKYLWNKINSVYTDRKFKRAATDQILRYKTDVFNTDIVDDKGYVTSKVDCGVSHIKLLHRAGDIVLDTNGEPIYEYRVGDILLDSNNKPIIDTLYGIERYVDIFMIQYEYKVANDFRYNDYFNNIIEIIRKWVTYDMDIVNDAALEHTQIYYKPRKSNVSVILEDGTKVKNIISPNVTLYMDSVVFSSALDINSLKRDIGKIIHKYIEKRVVVLEDIKQEIMRTLGSGVVGVKIDGITTSNDEILTFKEYSNRLSIKKIINEFDDVVYDVGINIVKV